MAVPQYVQELGSDALSKKGRNFNKTFSSLHGKPHLRFIWINDTKEDKMCTESFKLLCDGKMMAHRLYQNDEHKVEHHALPIITCNTIPNMNIDTGSYRCIESYYPISKFEPDELKVDESKHIYKVNDNLLQDWDTPEFLNAWTDIMAEYASRFINKERMTAPESLAKQDMVQMNDRIQDFIDARLKLVDIKNHDSEHKIGKFEMLEMYKNFFEEFGNISTKPFRLVEREGNNV